MRAVERLIQSESTQSSLEASLARLVTEHTEAVEMHLSPEGLATIEQKKEAVEVALERIKRACSKQKAELSVMRDGSLATYQAMKTDKFLIGRLNLRVLCDQILTKLRARKFELSNLDRAYRTRTLGVRFPCLCSMLTSAKYMPDRSANPRPCRAGNQPPSIRYCLNHQEL